MPKQCTSRSHVSQQRLAHKTSRRHRQQRGRRHGPLRKSTSTRNRVRSIFLATMPRRHGPCARVGTRGGPRNVHAHTVGVPRERGCLDRTPIATGHHCQDTRGHARIKTGRYKRSRGHDRQCPRNGKSKRRRCPFNGFSYGFANEGLCPPPEHVWQAPTCIPSTWGCPTNRHGSRASACHGDCQP
jgi:hypothetical protein